MALAVPLSRFTSRVGGGSAFFVRLLAPPNMKPFPDQHELIALFESEPVVKDVGVPWAYNHLTFTRTVGENRIECEIEPGYQELRFLWFQRGVVVVDLDLSWVSGLIVEREHGRESLIARFRERSGLLPLRIQISPSVYISWGTRTDIVGDHAAA